MNTATASPLVKMNLINFDGDQIEIAEKNNEHFIPLKSICQALGLDSNAQRQMIERDVVLSSVACIIHATGTDNKQYEMLCIPLSHLNGWLFKISPARYEGERQEKVIRYQKECYRVLHNHFFPHTPKKIARLKHKVTAKRLELSLIKADIAMEKQATEMAQRIYKGQGSLEDLNLCPEIQAMAREALEKLNQDSLFPQGAESGNQAENHA